MTERLSAEKLEQIAHDARTDVHHAVLVLNAVTPKEVEQLLDHIASLEADVRRNEFRRFCDEQAEWSRATFGPDNVRGPIGALKHLEKEAQEAQDAPSDIKEYVDCFFLVIDAALRAGFLDNLLSAAFAKLEENKQRTWPNWRTLPLDTAIEHVREEATRGK